MLGSPILYLKAMRILMFQLSGFYYRGILDSIRSCGCFAALRSSQVKPLCSGSTVLGFFFSFDNPQVVTPEP